MTKLLRLYSVLLMSILAFLCQSAFGQTGTSPCFGDTLAPVFERCPSAIVLTTTDTCAVAEWPQPLAFDNCGIYQLLASHQSGMCFKLGLTPVFYNAIDSAGNRTVCSFPVMINRVTPDTCVSDTTKPAFTFCPTNLTAQISSLGDTCTWVQWETPTAVDNCSTPSVISNYSSGECFNVGSTTVLYTAKDAKNNVSECLFTVTVTLPNIDSLLCLEDTIKPHFTSCPTNLTAQVSATSANNCVPVQWATPLAVDNCGIPRVVGNVSPGTCFLVGTTRVLYYARDAKNNVTTCAFSVTVTRQNLDSLLCTTDTIKPRFVNCPTNSIYTLPLTANGEVDTCMRIQWVTPVATDNCGTPTLVSNFQSGECFRVGTTPIAYTATDAKGNSSICSFTVTVVRPNLDSLACLTDTLRPYLTCPPNMTAQIGVVAGTNLDTCARLQWALPVATDNCGIPSVIGSHQSGMCFNVGTTPVVYTATDAKGNSSTCSFTVTVTRPNFDSVLCLTDTIRPHLTCPPSITAQISAIAGTNLDTCKHVQWALPVATDNCGTPSVIGSHQSGMCFSVGTTEVVYYAKDVKNNTSRCSFTVTVARPNLDSLLCATDTLKPYFTTCPSNMTAQLAVTGANLDTCTRLEWLTPVATDNCGTPSVISSHQLGACFKVGITPVVYTATDAKGNSSTCSFTVTVLRPNLDSLVCLADTLKPRFTFCPPNITVSTLDTCGRAQWSNPTALDNCTTPRVVGNFQSGDCFKIGTTPVVYTATDAKGNSSICSFSVSVANTNRDSSPCLIDTIRPRFTLCPQSKTVTSLDTCTSVQWDTPVATDNCGTPTVVRNNNLQSGACLRAGTTAFVYTATDAKGNVALCSFVITVAVTNPCATDTIRPRFTLCPQSKTVTSSDSCVRVQWDTPVATDNCGTPAVVGNALSGTCFRAGTTSVVYTATDAKGNVALCSFTITVGVTNPCATDTTKPRFTFCPQNITVNTLDTCGRAQWSNPTASDNCTTPRVVGNFQSGYCFRTGTTAVIYTATDTKGNSSTCSFNVTVTNPCATDTIKPRFTSCPANQTVSSLDTCAKVQWSTPKATDNCGIQKISGDYKSGDCFRAGTTVVTYTATDAKGNASICSFTVTVVNPCATDTTKPRFVNCPTNKVLTTRDTCARIQWSTPIAIDNCSNPTITSNVTSNTCFPTGVSTVVYTATDARGNISRCSLTVTVVNPCATDTIKPRFESCPTNKTVNTLDSCVRVQWTTPAATDNCTTPTVVSNFRSGDCFRAGTNVVTYTATDAKGNTSICSFTVTVANPCANDTIKPVFFDCPSNITTTTTDTAVKVSWRNPTASDYCGVINLRSSHQRGSMFRVGTTTVTYSATDARGNTGYCSFTVTVTNPCAGDSLAPVFTNCPANISVSTTSTSAIAQWTRPTATDNCGTPSIRGTANSGSSFPVGTTPVVYTATDSRGNVATCTFSVTVRKDTFVIDTAKCYILVARSSKKALSFASAAAGADAVQWTYLGGANQKWAITTADSNSVNLTVKSTNMNLDTRWGSLSNNSKLMQWIKTTTATQKWQLIPLSDGYFKVINKASGRALSVKGGNSATSDGSLIVQKDYEGATSQQWSIEAVSCVSAVGVNLASNDVLEVNAQAEAHRARIEWVDNTGYKNDYYEIEKLNTTSGKFESMALINNTVLDNQLTSQTAYDDAPTEGDNFYRVKVVYLDSLTKTSPVQKVSFNGLNTVKIFPNPASDVVDIDLTTYSNETVNIELYNSFGQKVAAQTVQKGKDAIVHLDISEHQTGNYLIRITAQGKRDVAKQLHIVR